ncbi:MAG TPA: hypothetical protein VLM89_08090 [Phycisphaerae bacterium]|nr:hypothetical protein [Phycisphaerae bacterium]
MRKRNWKRFWKWATITTASALLLVAVAGWMLFQRIPDWYHPAEAHPDEAQSVRDDFTGTYNNLSIALNESSGPFEFRLRQEQVNAWLSARHEIWPEARHWLPREVSGPQVIIEPGGIRLAAALRHSSLQAVISVRLKVSADDAGITVRLLGAAAGSLPIPKSQTRQFLTMLDQGGNWPAGRRADGQLGDRSLPALGGLFDGVVFSNRWIWHNGRQPFKITRITCRPGELVLTFHPLPRQADRSSGSLRLMDFGSTGDISPGSGPAGSR